MQKGLTMLTILDRSPGVTTGVEFFSLEEEGPGPGPTGATGTANGTNLR